jgi:hypothetical protein
MPRESGVLPDTKHWQKIFFPFFQWASQKKKEKKEGGRVQKM